MSAWATAARPANYNGTTASQVMAAHARSGAVRPRPKRTLGKVADVTHPLFQRYNKELKSLAWPRYRFTATWSVNPKEVGTRVLLSYADSAPGSF